MAKKNSDEDEIEEENVNNTKIGENDAQEEKENEVVEDESKNVGRLIKRWASQNYR